MCNACAVCIVLCTIDGTSYTIDVIKVHQFLELHPKIFVRLYAGIIISRIV